MIKKLNVMFHSGGVGARWERGTPNGLTNVHLPLSEVTELVMLGPLAAMLCSVRMLILCRTEIRLC